MKIFLSAIESAPKCNAQQGGKEIADMLIDGGVKMKWNLMSYYYIRGRKEPLANRIRDNSEEILIDSGAHSFQFGKKVDWVAYTEEYAKWIQSFDRPHVRGYFEMDIENIIGYERVLELRKILEKQCGKIIPVWHPLRGIKDYEKMCESYSNKIIAIGGFRGTDIKDNQYLSFVKVARKYGCKVHCLGMTRTQVLDKVPFDFTDSSSWLASARFGTIGNAQFKQGKVTQKFSKTSRGIVYVESYKAAMRMQNHYHEKWKLECND